MDTGARPFAAAERQMQSQGERGRQLVNELRPFIDAIAHALLALDLRFAAIERQLATPDLDDPQPLIDREDCA